MRDAVPLQVSIECSHPFAPVQRFALSVPDRTYFALSALAVALPEVAEIQYGERPDVEPYERPRVLLHLTNGEAVYEVIEREPPEILGCQLVSWTAKEW